MTTTFSTDTDITEADKLARTARDAVSSAEIEAGGSAVTDFDGFRVRAKRQILIDLGARDITESQVTNTDAMITVEVECALWLLFASVAQYTSAQQDIYAARARDYEARYLRNVAKVNPIARVRGVGMSFEWGRG